MLRAVSSKNTQLLSQRAKSHISQCPRSLQTVFYTHCPSHIRRKGGKDNKIRIWKEAQGNGFEKHAAFVPASQKRLGF